MSKKNKNKYDVIDLLFELDYRKELSSKKVWYLNKSIEKAIIDHFTQCYDKYHGEIYFSLCDVRKQMNNIFGDDLSCCVDGKTIKLKYNRNDIGKFTIVTIDDSLKTQVEFYNKIKDEFEKDYIDNKKIMDIIQYENLITINWIADKCADEVCCCSCCSCCSCKCNCCCKTLKCLGEKEYGESHSISKTLEIHGTVRDVLF